MTPAVLRSARLPYLTGVAGALTIAFSAIFVRFAGVPPSTSAVFRCVYALPLLILLASRERHRYGPRTVADRRWALLAGLFFTADLVTWHHAIEAVGAGLATVLANTQIVVTGLVAWAALGERPTRQVMTAVPVVLVGVVLISGVVGENAYGANPVLGVALGLTTALAYSGFLLVLRRGNRDLRRPAGPLLDATLVAALGSLAAGAVLGELELTPTWPAHGWLLLLAVTSQVIGWVLISVSLPRLPALVTSVVLTLQPVGSVVLAVLLLRETPSAVQVTGVLVVLAGVILATLGRSARSGGDDPVDAPVAVPAAP